MMKSWLRKYYSDYRAGYHWFLMPKIDRPKIHTQANLVLMEALPKVQV
jgi:hypothetical protein